MGIDPINVVALPVEERWQVIIKHSVDISDIFLLGALILLVNHLIPGDII